MEKDLFVEIWRHGSLSFVENENNQDFIVAAMEVLKNITDWK